MLEQIKIVLMEQLHLKKNEILPTSRIKADLGADSLDVLELLMMLEEKTGKQIPDEALASFETVQDIVDYLEKK